MAEVPRNVQWEGLSDSDRLRLMANDLDRIDARQERIDARLGKIMAICVGILVSLLTSSILLVVQLSVGGSS